jgi:large subunit ribosomal protein L10
MNQSEKNVIVDDLKQALALEGGALVLVDFQGMNVAATNEVRTAFRDAECSYKVVKNTLLKRAVEGTPLEAIAPLCRGCTAIAYSRTDPVAPAKAAVQCQKDHKHFTVKGGFFEDFLDAANVTQLSKMPSTDELRSKLLATMLAAPQNLLRLLQAAPQRMLMVLEARKRELEG